MAVVTWAISLKGALNHIITIVLVYDSCVRKALGALGASDELDFMDLYTTDFKLQFTCPDKDDASTSMRASSST
jgi:hypothetical protein